MARRHPREPSFWAWLRRLRLTSAAASPPSATCPGVAPAKGGRHGDRSVETAPGPQINKLRGRIVYVRLTVDGQRRRPRGAWRHHAVPCRRSTPPVRRPSTIRTPLLIFRGTAPISTDRPRTSAFGRALTPRHVAEGGDAA